MNNLTELEALNTEMAKMCSFSEAIKGFKDELKRIYPEELFICFAAEHEQKGTNTGLISFHEFGDEGLIDDLGTLAMKNDKRAAQFIQNAYLNWMMDQSPEGKSEEFNRIRDAVLLYAQSKGYDISKFRYHKKIHYLVGQSIDPNDTEKVVSILEKEIERVKNLRSPLTTITLLNAEIKRLRKAGDFAGVAKKTVELNTILDEEKKRKEDEKRKAENRKVALENLAKGRAIRKANIERKKQAELDRQRGRQQFQPGKAAKKKQQQIRERQAERNARKKKGKEQDDFRIVRNACSLGR